MTAEDRILISEHGAMGMILPGEGMPVYGRPLQRGALHLRLSMQFNVPRPADAVSTILSSVAAAAQSADDEAVARALQVGVRGDCSA